MLDSKKLVGYGPLHNPFGGSAYALAPLMLLLNALFVALICASCCIIVSCSSFVAAAFDGLPSVAYATTRCNSGAIVPVLWDASWRNSCCFLELSEMLQSLRFTIDGGLHIRAFELFWWAAAGFRTIYIYYLIDDELSREENEWSGDTMAKLKKWSLLLTLNPAARVRVLSGCQCAIRLGHCTGLHPSGV